MPRVAGASDAEGPTSAARHKCAAARYPRRGAHMNSKIIVAAIAVVAVFLIGFVPQYVKVNRLEVSLRQSRQENAGAHKANCG
jgi:hypothetical protein